MLKVRGDIVLELVRMLALLFIIGIILRWVVLGVLIVVIRILEIMRPSTVFRIVVLLMGRKLGDMFLIKHVWNYAMLVPGEIIQLGCLSVLLHAQVYLRNGLMMDLLERATSVIWQLCSAYRFVLLLSLVPISVLQIVPAIDFVLVLHS